MPDRPRYVLSITYRSNEHPFSTLYEPYPSGRFGEDDDAARGWAADMAARLLDYDVTLFRDGKPLVRTDVPGSPIMYVPKPQT